MAESTDVSALVKELKAGIDDGKAVKVKAVLDKIKDKKTITEIEKNFPSTDPLNHAINEGKEKIAILLVEKGFCTTHMAGHCDQWCYYNDHPDTLDCPNQKNAEQNASGRDFDDLVKAIKKAQTN